MVYRYTYYDKVRFEDSGSLVLEIDDVLKLGNNKSIQWYDTGGTLRNVLSYGDDDILRLTNPKANEDLHIGNSMSGGGIYIGYESNSDVAVGTGTTKPANVTLDCSTGLHLKHTGNTRLGIAATLIPYVDLVPSGTVDLGTDSNQFTDLHIDGWGYIDSLRIDVALNLDQIDQNSSGGGSVVAAVPVTAEGTTEYIYLYDTA